MSYKHRILGVECLTANELVLKDAHERNCSAIDVMNEMLNDVVQSQESERIRILADKADAFEKLEDYYNPEYCDTTFQPVQILEMLYAEVHFSVRKNVTSFTAKVLCSDVTRILKYTETQYAGTYIDPPDFDYNCVEVCYG